MSTLNLLLSLFFHSVDQFLVISLQHNRVMGVDRLISQISFKWRLLTFFKLRFIFLNYLSILVSLYRFVQEDVLGIFECSWEPIKDVSSIATSILRKSQLEDSIEELVWYTYLRVFDYNVRPTIFWFLLICSSLCDIFLNLGFGFFYLGSAIVNESIFSSLLFVNGSHSEDFINKFFDIHFWDIVVFCQFICIKCLTWGWWPSYENLDWVKTSEFVEFLV